MKGWLPADSASPAHTPPTPHWSGCSQLGEGVPHPPGGWQRDAAGRAAVALGGAVLLWGDERKHLIGRREKSQDSKGVGKMTSEGG